MYMAETHVYPIFIANTVLLGWRFPHPYSSYFSRTSVRSSTIWHWYDISTAHLGKNRSANIDYNSDNSNRIGEVFELTQIETILHHLNQIRIKKYPFLIPVPSLMWTTQLLKENTQLKQTSTDNAFIRSPPCTYGLVFKSHNPVIHRAHSEPRPLTLRGMCYLLQLVILPREFVSIHGHRKNFETSFWARSMKVFLFKPKSVGLVLNEF